MAGIRKARLRDVGRLVEIINDFANRRLLLPRTPSDLCERIREMTVVEDEGKLVGCGALHFYSPEIAAIRSLGVLPGTQRRGLGRKLTEFLLEEASEQGLKCVFALTLVPEYFERLGFAEVGRETLPMKVWRDCIHCEKYFRCDEKAVVYFLDKEARLEADNRKAVVEA